MRIANRWAAPRVIAEEWREFTRPPLYLLLALGLLLIALAYQVRAGAELRVDLGIGPDQPYLSGFNGRESNKQLNYRWSSDRSTLIVPGPGRDQGFDLVMNIIGYRPAGQLAATLTVTIRNNTVVTLQPLPYPTAYTVTIPVNLNTADDLAISFTSNAFSLPGDPRVLGVIFDSLTLIPSPGAGMVRLPTSVTAWLLLALLLLYLTLRHLRVGWRAAWTASAALMLVAAALLVSDRYDLTLFALPLLTVTLCAYGMALLLPPVVAWTLTRLGAKPSEAAVRALMLIYLAAFAIKAGGMMHPQFRVLDQGLRAHQVQELIVDPAAFWDKYQHISTADTSGGARSDGLSLLGQWHLRVPFPYPPLAYYLLVPFGLLWPKSADTDLLITACDTALAALASTAAFALYALAKRGLGSGRAGIIAAAIALFAPISYLHFSDGDWTYIWGGWVALVYIMAAVCLADRAHKPLPFAILSLLAAFALALHTATALFAAAFVPLAIVGLLVMRRQGRFGFPLWPLLASFLAGAALSLIYYGAYIVPMLTVTLPAIIAHLGSGLGQEQRFLGRPLLVGFWPQVWAHFAAWPLPLAVAGLALLMTQRWRVGGEAVEDGVRRFCVGIIIAWAGVFALFSLADLKVNLLQRHMLFALPLLGLLAGYALVRLMQWGTHSDQPFSGTGANTYRSRLLEVIKRERLGWLVAAGLVAFLFVVGWEIWLNRVLHYVLPPGSG